MRTCPVVESRAESDAGSRGRQTLRSAPRRRADDAQVALGRPPCAAPRRPGRPCGRRRRRSRPSPPTISSTSSSSPAFHTRRGVVDSTWHEPAGPSSNVSPSISNPARPRWTKYSSSCRSWKCSNHSVAGRQDDAVRRRTRSRRGRAGPCGRRRRRAQRGWCGRTARPKDSALAPAQVPRREEDRANLRHRRLGAHENEARPGEDGEPAPVRAPGHRPNLEPRARGQAFRTGRARPSARFRSGRRGARRQGSAPARRSGWSGIAR